MEDWREPLLEVASVLRDHVSRQSDGDSTSDDDPDPDEFFRLIEDEDYYRIHAGDLPARQYGTIKEVRGVSTLVFDPENIPKEVLLGAREVFDRTFEDLDGFALEGRGSIAAVMKDEGNRDLFEEIYDFYEFKIPRRFLPVLEDAITLRIIEREEEISWGELYDWRGEIADNYKRNGGDPQEAQNLISLCSAGYLDRGEFFRVLYEDCLRSGEWSDGDYRDAFTKYVKNKPFVVFVQSRTMDKDDVYAIAKDKSKRVNKYPGSPQFVDLCGKGDASMSIVERSLREFQDNHENIQYKCFNQEKWDQYIVRIDIETL
jgi:hypothetical protein